MLLRPQLPTAQASSLPGNQHGPDPRGQAEPTQRGDTTPGGADAVCVGWDVLRRASDVPMKGPQRNGAERKRAKGMARAQRPDAERRAEPRRCAPVLSGASIRLYGLYSCGMSRPRRVRRVRSPSVYTLRDVCRVCAVCCSSCELARCCLFVLRNVSLSDSLPLECLDVSLRSTCSFFS